jgi:GTP cyclohydrolase FolE2
MMSTMSDEVNARLKTIEGAIHEQRALMNLLVETVNEMATNFDLVRIAVRDQAASLARLETEVSRISSTRLGKLTPLPALYEAQNG